MQRLFLVLFLIYTALLAPSAHAKSPAVTLVYVSHMADISGYGGGAGYAELATLVKELRANNANVILFHGGNVLGPSALSSYDKGAHIIGILNALQPDVLGLGRRDFMHKEDELVLRSGEAVFPMICSNIYDPISLEAPGDTHRGYIVKSAVPVGFLSLVSPEMQTTYMQRRLVTVGGYESLPNLVSELRDNGASYVVATMDFTAADVAGALVDEFGPDLLFLSEAGETGLKINGGRAVAAHAGNSDDVLVIGLALGQEGRLGISGYEVLHLKDYRQDPEMAGTIGRYSGLFLTLTRMSVGRVLTQMDTRTPVLRSGENAMGNLVCDALRDYYGADIAIMNSGGIRGNRIYEAGVTLNRGDLQRELPLHDVSCLVYIDGETILQALEHGVAQVELARGKFLQVSGLSYEYDLKRAPGSRVVKAMIDGKPLNSDAIYSVALPEYLNENGDGFGMFSNECSSMTKRPQQELVDILRVYLSMHSPVSPRVEGRIKAVE